jgi:hypothetical protein
MAAGWGGQRGGGPTVGYAGHRGHQRLLPAAGPRSQRAQLALHCPLEPAQRVRHVVALAPRSAAAGGRRGDAARAAGQAQSGGRSLVAWVSLGGALHLCVLAARGVVFVCGRREEASGHNVLE